MYTTVYEDGVVRAEIALCEQRWRCAGEVGVVRAEMVLCEPNVPLCEVYSVESCHVPAAFLPNNGAYSQIPCVLEMC